MLRFPTPPAPRSLAGFALAVLLALALGGAPPAEAAFAPNGIEIDGDHLDGPDPADDWFPDHPPMSDPLSGDDDTLCGTDPAPKNDIINSYLANDGEFLYLGMERRTNNGNTSFFFSFDITGDGPSLGDFIFVFCFGSGAVVTETYVLEWDPALLEWAVDSSPPTVRFAVNTAPIPAPFGTFDERGRPANTLDEGRFAEAAITLADIEGFDICTANAVVGEIQTKSSCSLNSECKDTTGPFTFSFEPLTADLVLSQASGCAPRIRATANADTRAGASAVTYQWFLDGVDITDRDPRYSTSDTIEIELEGECGPTEVSVVVDDGTCTVDDSATVDVNGPPVAIVGLLAAGACDRTIVFDGTASLDCNGDALSFGWDFDGDGVVDSTDPAGTWTVGSCGTRAVTLVVSDGECESEPVAALVHVNEPPVASLQVTPTGCLAISWQSLSTDCDLLSPSPLHVEDLSFQLDLGDGSPPIGELEAGDHVYADCGERLLTLTVTDASGCTSTDERRVAFTGVLTVD